MGIIKKFQNFIDDSRHVLSISYKPSNEQFNKSARLIIIGILLIGFIGYVISIIVSLIIQGRI